MKRPRAVRTHRLTPDTRKRPAPASVVEVEGAFGVPSRHYRPGRSGDADGGGGHTGDRGLCGGVTEPAWGGQAVTGALGAAMIPALSAAVARSMTTSCTRTPALSNSAAWSIETTSRGTIDPVEFCSTA